MDDRTGDFCVSPPSLRAERRGEVAVLRLHREQKRNALDDTTVVGIEAFFTSLPDAEEGHAIRLTQYLVEVGAGLAKGIERAERIAANTPFTNFAATHMLPHIARGDPATGFATEALTAAIAQGNGEAKRRLNDFLEKRGPKVVRG